MIINLQPVEVLFDKIIGDSGLSPHEIRTDLWKRWCAEAMGHIGGLSRIVYMRLLAQGLLISGSIEIGAQPQSINGVKYWIDEKTHDNKGDYKLAIHVKSEELNKKSDTIQWVELLPMSYGDNMAIILNRTDGYVEVLGEKKPLDDKDNLLLPEIDSYMEAVYWYIMMKIYYREMAQGKQGKDRLHQYAAGMFNNMKQYAFGELMAPDKWELKKLANELSLGVCYSGLKQERNTLMRWWFGEDVLQPMAAWDKTKPFVYPPDFIAPWYR